MDIMQLLIHPFFFIPLFFVLAMIAVVGGTLVKSNKVRKMLVIIIVVGFLVFCIPYLYAIAWWFLVNVLHVVQ